MHVQTTTKQQRKSIRRCADKHNDLGFSQELSL